MGWWKELQNQPQRDGLGSTFKGLLSLPSGHFLHLQNGAEMLALPAAGKLGGPEEALEMGALWKVTRCVHFMKASFLLAGRFWTG